MKELFVFRAFHIIIIESTRDINSYSITYMSITHMSITYIMFITYIMSIMSIFSSGLLSRIGCDFYNTDHITFGQCDPSCDCCSKHQKREMFEQVIKAR